MHPARTVLLIACCAASACAGTVASFPAPSPDEIPDLEALSQRDPTEANTALLLAAAYRQQGRIADATDVVSAARNVAAGAGPLDVMAGLLHEDAGEWTAARDAYAVFLASNTDGDLRDEVEQRLEGVRRHLLRADVRRALSDEARLAQTSPDPGTVGIFPFVYDGGDDESWRPLGRALADLLVTDLGVTGRLRVLERIQVQTLVDELALSGSGLVEPTTAARSGRLLGSGHVVQGRYRIGTDGRLGVDAAVVRVGAPGDTDVQPVTGVDAPDRLFDLEKQLALDLHAELGIQLTPAERARVNERATESVQALLAYGRGLTASDAGDFESAESNFAEAVRLDPAFGLAGSRRLQAATRSRTGAQRLTGRTTRLAQRRQAVRALRQSPAALRQHILKNITQRQRAALAEVLGQDRLGSAILLELVFRRPGGGP